MLNRAEVDRLLAAPAAREGWLTAYVDVDQSRAVNLNRGFETAVQSAVRELEPRVAPDARPAYERAGRRLAALLADYRPAARTLAAAIGDDGQTWTTELRGVGLPTALHWGPHPVVRPLLELLDDHERCAVVLADKEQARLLTVSLGEIEEEQFALAAAETRHKQASGTDHWRSQMQFQRQDDTHVRWHLDHVVELLDGLARERAFGRLVLGGPVSATTQLAALLPERLRARVVGTIHLPVRAPATDVLRETAALATTREQADEAAMVEAAVVAAGKEANGVLGVEPTLQALQAGRVLTLLYADGYRADGAECAACGALFARRVARCGYCDGATRALPDLLERAVARAVGAGARIERVSGAAAERLRAAGGGIGALLRF